jgi:hypothetical protein
VSTSEYRSTGVIGNNNPTPTSLSPTHVEALAKAAHQRWCWRQVLDGYTQGEAVEGEKRNPRIVLWEVLATEHKAESLRLAEMVPELIFRAELELEQREPFFETNPAP